MIDFLDINAKRCEAENANDTYIVQQSELTKPRKEDKFFHMPVA